ncbi:myrosinase 1-like [Anthonomus grandis grandis]|uniref:myrosinase 1-like n=1 Tax=Anthonomus grandis grandis TaxID=2921223 RepID=UPI00216591DA|nr:myrosinase 1-like [Anthonomus grandis grandis]
MYLLQYFQLLILLLAKSSLGDKKIPENFLLGSATASYQIEGAWNEDGKGESMWDWFMHSRNSTKNGDVACDSYHKWKEDIENVKALGLDFYRISISWPRILPNGTLSSINQKGIDYYMNIFKALKEANIEPMVTLYHWDMPEHIHQLGGFLNPQFVDYFEDYARLMYKLFAPYVKYWFTINEPTLICTYGYGYGIMAPGLTLIGDGIYQCGYVLLKAHAKAYRVYDEEFRAKYQGQVGLVFSFDWVEPYTNSTFDIEAQQRYLEFQLGWWANPVFIGNWPQIMIERIANRSKLEGLARSRLPEFSQQEIDYIKGTYDFFALNTYNVGQVRFLDEPDIGTPSYLADQSVTSVLDDNFYHPEGIRMLMNYIWTKYNPKGILITENGKRTTDKLQDTERISLIRDYLSQIIDAKTEDGINILGYSVWSLMDNFEWGSYKDKYGIIRVDFDSPDRTRTWKDSAHWFKNLTTNRVLDV